MPMRLGPLVHLGTGGGDRVRRPDMATDDVNARRQPPEHQAAAGSHRFSHGDTHGEIHRLRTALSEVTVDVQRAAQGIDVMLAERAVRRRWISPWRSEEHTSDLQ